MNMLLGTFWQPLLFVAGLLCTSVHSRWLAASCLRRMLFRFRKRRMCQKRAAASAMPAHSGTHEAGLQHSPLQFDSGHNQWSSVDPIFVRVCENGWGGGRRFFFWSFRGPRKHFKCLWEKLGRTGVPEPLAPESAFQEQLLICPGMFQLIRAVLRRDYLKGGTRNPIKGTFV